MHQSLSSVVDGAPNLFICLETEAHTAFSYIGWSRINLFKPAAGIIDGDVQAAITVWSRIDGVLY